MADICNEAVNDGEAKSSACDSKRVARRRRVHIRRFGFPHRTESFGHMGDELEGGDCKRNKEGKNEATNDGRSSVDGYSGTAESGLLRSETAKDDDEVSCGESSTLDLSHSLITVIEAEVDQVHPKYGVATACGRRRDMEDAVAIHPSFCRNHPEYSTARWHYFGVYDGHGCSHVATRCRDRLHELVEEELLMEGVEECWKGTMERSFTRMDKEVVLWNKSVLGGATCKCELQTPEYNAVGSTAVVSIITPERIVVANCGDSRAVLCRKGKPVPLSADHKPDRPDELNRIEAAGGRVIYWDGPRVLGVLAMSRAIGDNYLKPYVSCEPEVTLTDRTDDDDYLILATDGLWDVVSNETACEVVSTCLREKARGRRRRAAAAAEWYKVGWINGGKVEMSDKACTEASVLLTRMALARHGTDNVSVVVIDLRR